MAATYSKAGITVVIGELRGEKVDYSSPGSPLHHGFLNYELTPGSLEVHTIDAQPFRSGLGSLLMFEVALIAARYAKAMVTAVNVALDAQGFYRKLGFQPSLAELEAINTGRFSEEEKAVLRGRVPTWQVVRNTLQLRAINELRGKGWL